MFISKNFLHHIPITRRGNIMFIYTSVIFVILLVFMLHVCNTMKQYRLLIDVHKTTYIKDRAMLTKELTNWLNRQKDDHSEIRKLKTLVNGLEEVTRQSFKEIMRLQEKLKPEVK